MKIEIKGKEIDFNPETLEPFIFAKEKKYKKCDVCPDKFHQICLQTTYRCNLACKYCFVEEYSHKKNMDMKIEIAIKAIDNYSNEKCGVNFFGGEPLLNWDIIYQIIKKYPKKHFATTSNFTNLTEEMIRVMKKYNFSYIVSLDGDEKTHNFNRPHKCNKNSYKMTVNNLNLMHNIYKSRLPITLRATFDNTPDVNILKTIKHLNSFIKKGIVKHASVEPASGTEKFQNSFTQKNKDFFQQQYYEIAEYFLETFRKKGYFPRFHHFNYPIEKTLLLRNKKRTECGAGKGYVSVSTNGDIYPCHREETPKIGNVNTGLNKTEQEKWLENRYINKEICNECWARNFCGGGCRTNAYIKNKNILKPSETGCFFMKARTKAVLWLWNQLSKPEILFLQMRMQIKPRNIERTKTNENRIV